MGGFDAAQTAHDNAVPEYLEDAAEDEDEWCPRCGDQGVCPECNPRRPWED